MVSLLAIETAVVDALDEKKWPVKKEGPSLAVIGKDNLDPERVTGFVQQPGQYPHRIEKLDGIKRLMNIAFNNGAVDTGLSPFLDVFGFGLHQQIPRDALPCIRRNSFDVGV